MGFAMKNANLFEYLDMRQAWTNFDEKTCTFETIARFLFEGLLVAHSYLHILLNFKLLN